MAKTFRIRFIRDVGRFISKGFEFQFMADGISDYQIVKALEAAGIVPANIGLNVGGAYEIL